MNWPNQPEEYGRAREELLQAEIKLRRQEEAVAAQRRALPLGGEVTGDYVFDSQSGPVTFAELFANGKDTLYLYTFMFIPGEQGLPLEVACPSCTSIIDAMDGQALHLAQQINFAVSAKAPIARFRAHAEARGWRHARLLSAAGSTYNRDYQAEEPDGSQNPIATVFVRRGGQIHHSWSSELYHVPSDAGQDMRHVDFMWPLWPVLDRTPEGRGTDWRPELEYGG